MVGGNVTARGGKRGGRALLLTGLHGRRQRHGAVGARRPRVLQPSVAPRLRAAERACAWSEHRLGRASRAQRGGGGQRRSRLPREEEAPLAFGEEQRQRGRLPVRKKRR